MTVNLPAKRRRRAHVPYEAKLFRQRLSLDEELDVSAMVAEKQKLQARAAEFSESLPDVCSVLRAFANVKLPRAATVADLPVAM